MYRAARNIEMPQGFHLVDGQDIAPGEYIALLEEIALTVDPEDQERYPTPASQLEPATPDFRADTILEQFALGVRDDEDRLAAYVSATIDRDDSNAMVDFIGVRRIERGLGVGTALADAMLRQLDIYGFNTISFEPFGEIWRLVPYLVEHKGFIYSTTAGEFCSYRETASALDQLVVPEEWGVEELTTVDNEALQQTVGPDEMAEFRDVVSSLLRACVELHNAGSRTKINTNGAVFDFENGGREFRIIENLLKTFKVWRVREKAEEIIPHPDKQIVSPERTFTVYQMKGKAMPTVPDFDVGQLEAQGANGVMRPFVFAKGVKAPEGLHQFTRARHQKIMASLRRLSPEHLVELEQV